MITRDTILGIIEQSNPDGVNISIFIPTHEKGEEVQQDPIRLKNQLSEVKNELLNKGMSEDRIQDLLEEPLKLLDQPIFWQHNEKGLALFINEGFFEYYKVPLKFKERHLISDTFLITPLIPMITLEGTFCMVAISRKNIRLLKATRDTVEELELEEAPTSMEEFQKYNEYEKSLSTARGSGSIHGWGDVEFDQKEVENYLKNVENDVTSVMKKRHDPLILCGVDQAVSVYRKVNHYSRLLEPVNSGNPDPKSDEELRDEGWEIIKSYFLKEMYEDLEKFNDLTGSDRQSEDLSKIVESAYYGKVESLFLPVGTHSWGKFDEESRVVHISDERKDSESDLLNLAAIKTLTQGGNVYALKPEEMPDDTSIAAVFRYS